MILNLIFLLITIFVIYFGYTYKASILFILTMVLDDLYIFLYKFKSYKMIYDKDLECYTMNFFLEDKEYIMKIPKEDVILKRSKILALSGKSNKTDFILKILGPLQNCFGTKQLKIKQLGLEELEIWKDKKRYCFKENDEINFDKCNNYKYSDSESE